MLQNPRLGAPAFASLHFAATYQWPDGWSLTAVGRREGCAEFEKERYERLDVFELASLVPTILELRLGL